MTITLYHATSVAKADIIRSEGMLAGSYWGEEKIADYYAETVEEDGDDYVIISVSLDELIALGETHISPDHAGIEEPLTFTLKKTQEEIELTWSASAQNWRASLDIIRSVRFMAPIPAEMLTLEYPEGCEM